MTLTSVDRERNGGDESDELERILCWGRTRIGARRRGPHTPAAGIGVRWAAGRCMRSHRSTGSTGFREGWPLRRAGIDGSFLTKSV